MFSKLTQYKSLILTALLPIVFFSDQTIAQLEPQVKEPNVNHERLYQVEVIVFGRSETNPQETWPTDIRLSYPENLSFISESNLSENFTLVPANERSLNPQAATLARSGSYTLLFHQAWRQTIYASKTNIMIAGGKVFNEHHELEGSISLSVGQYLKIQTNLWLTKFAPFGTSVADTWPELPSIPGTFATEVDKSQQNPIQRIVKLNQERTMRSNEVHYMDHPLMGVFVKIIPVETQTEKSIN
ncbi:MAG: CsiV family protein [Cellvibrio sp.]